MSVNIKRLCSLSIYIFCFTVFVTLWQMGSEGLMGHFSGPQTSLVTCLQFVMGMTFLDFMSMISHF